MLVRDAESQAVRSVLNAMSPPLREILILREFEELSYRQIAEITALPIGTVMSRLARARKAFAAAWQREKQSNATNETELFTTRSSEVSARSVSSGITRALQFGVRRTSGESDQSGKSSPGSRSLEIPDTCL
jgi:hypothetical protein